MKLPNMFAKDSQPQAYSSGSVIFSEGEAGEVMYLIQAGEVEILVGDRIVTSIGADEIVGEMALIDDQPRSATARARTDCELVRITKKQFVFMMEETPFFASEILRIISTRLRRMDYQLQSQHKQTV